MKDLILKLYVVYTIKKWELIEILKSKGVLK